MLQLDTKANSAISALAFSPDGMGILVGYANGGVQEWDAFGSLIGLDTEDSSTESAAVAWRPGSSSWAYTAGVFLVTMEAGSKVDVTTFTGSSAILTGIAYLSDELAIIGQGHPTRSDPGALRLHTFVWEERRGQPSPTYEAAGVRGLDIHRESRLVAWITGNAQLKFWRTDRPDHHALSLKKSATKVVLSPDGLTAAIAVEWSVFTYSTIKRFPLQELKGHKGKVTSLAFSPDGSRIVTGSWDETVREWDAATGKELRSMNWKIGKIAALSYAPDGTRIAAGSTSGNVIIWDVD